MSAPTTMATGPLDRMNRLAVGGTTRTQDRLSMAPNAAWFRAKQGDAEAQYVLAQCYLHGFQQETSPKQALIFFGKAASHGHVEAQFHYGLQFLNGVGMTKKDPGQAVFWFTKAAQAGHSEAMYTLGMMSLQGIGVIESEQIALDWFIKSARSGFKEAQYRYATYLERGEYIDLNMQKALLFYLKAAEQEHPQAQHRAAILYSQGINVKTIVDEDKKAWHTFPSVITWAKSTIHATRLHEAKRWNSLSSVVSWYILPKNLLSQVDWISAAYWHDRAAKSNFMPSKYALAVQVQDGLGVPIDHSHAFCLFREAALGHISDEVGALNEVQYFCPHCGQWNRNEASKEKVKGDIRCTKCREDRIFPKNMRSKHLTPFVRAPTPSGAHGRQAGAQKHENDKHAAHQAGAHKHDHDKHAVHHSHHQHEDSVEVTQIFLDSNDLKQILQIKELKYVAEPQIMHILAEVGEFITATIVNDSSRDSGSFYIDFYVCGSDENVAEVGIPVYGGRILMQNVQARSTQVVTLPHTARCPLDAKSGDGKLWAGIKAISFTDPPGDQALNWSRSAVTGNVEAIAQLADSRWYGKGVESHLREAIQWYRKIAGSGSGESGLICPRSTDIIIMHSGPIPNDLCPLTITRGYKPAWLAFALCLDELNRPQNDPLTKWHRELVTDNHEIFPEAGAPASWMHLAAEHGCIAQAQLNLAVWYVQARHVPRSLPQAWYWFKQAADQDLADAQYNLALLYQAGEAVEADESRAAVLFTRAVEQGHIPAHLSLGVCYLEGKGVPPDLDKAIYLLSVPAHKGWDIAQFNLGCLYARGWGLPRDYVKSAEWHYKAAQQGHREAQVCFAMAVYRGQGVPHDLDQAALLFRKSAEQGHPQAQFNLGVMYARGEGVQLDMHAAAIWWEQAAQQGHALAQFELGQYHLMQSEVAQKELKQVHANRMLELSSDRQIFEKYSLVSRFRSGNSAAISREAMTLALDCMDRKQYLKVLEDFHLLPQYISREEAFELLKSAPGNQNLKAVNFPTFCHCIHALRGRIKLKVAETGLQFGDRHSRLIAGYEEMMKKEEDPRYKEILAVNATLHVLRGLPQPSVPNFRTMQENFRNTSERAEYLRSTVKDVRTSLKFHLWRAKDASIRYALLRAETDALLVGGHSEELKKKRAVAERVRIGAANAKNAARADEAKLEKSEEDLRQVLELQKLAEGKVAFNCSSDQRRQEQWFEDLAKGIEKGRVDMMKQEQDVKARILYHFQRAASLFLDAARQNNGKAQHNLGHIFQCNEPLPVGWLPSCEEELEDKDMIGLQRFRKDMETLRLFQEEQRNSTFVCFSFQTTKPEGTRVDGNRSRIKQQRSRNDNISPEPKATTIVEDGLALQEQATREFNQWMAERFRKEQAAYWFMESAKSGHIGSQYEVGMLHLNGYDLDQMKRRKPYISLPKDLIKAAKWLLRSAEGGYAKAQFEYASGLIQGHFKQHDDGATALDWLERSASQELPEAMLYLSQCYEKGSLVQKDASRARALLRSAAAKGNVDAMISWATLCLESARDVNDAEPSLLTEGIAWLREAAAEEHPEAKLQLARCLQEGTGVEKDEACALQLLSEAAELHPAAGLELGLCYQYGIGVASSLETAVRCFVRSAEGGNAEAMLNLYFCYSLGSGAAEDVGVARHWLGRAAGAGNSKAIAIDAMLRQVPPPPLPQHIK